MRISRGRFACQPTSSARSDAGSIGYDDALHACFLRQWHAQIDLLLLAQILWSQVVETVRPINADEIEVDASAFEPYLTIGERRAVSNPTRIVVTLERSSEYPATEEHLQLACEQSGASLTGRLAVEALARGYVRCELFGAEERYLGSATIRISEFIKVHGFVLGKDLPLPGMYRRILPLRPIFPGFLLNTAFYAVILWLLWSAPFATRRLIRKRRGRCVRCGYDLGHAEHDVCPECGA